jgi:hypothetical protein
MKDSGHLARQRAATRYARTVWVAVGSVVLHARVVGIPITCSRLFVFDSVPGSDCSLTK